MSEKRIIDGIITPACLNRLMTGVPEDIELSDGSVIRLRYTPSPDAEIFARALGGVGEGPILLERK